MATWGAVARERCRYFLEFFVRRTRERLDAVGATFGGAQSRASGLAAPTIRTSRGVGAAFARRAAALRALLEGAARALRLRPGVQGAIRVVGAAAGQALRVAWRPRSAILFLGALAVGQLLVHVITAAIEQRAVPSPPQPSQPRPSQSRHEKANGNRAPSAETQDAHGTPSRWVQVGETIASVRRGQRHARAGERLTRPAVTSPTAAAP